MYLKKDDIVGGVLLLGALLVCAAFFFLAKQTPQRLYAPVEIAGSALAATPIDETQVNIIVTSTRSGFITMHESLGGAPGPIIGISSLFDAGDMIERVMTLSTPMTTGLPYIALLHVDDGDGHFVVANDMPVTNNGTSVRANIVGL